MKRSAFLVVVAVPGRAIPASVRHLVEAPQTPHVHFDPASHVAWSSASGDLRVGCWAEAADTADAGIDRWLVTDRAIAAATGHVRVRGDAWTQRSWAAAAATLDPGDGAGAGELTGIFTALHASLDGRAVIVAHELGAGYLFWAQRPDCSIIASTPALAAHALAGGATPERDAFAATGLAHTRARVGTRTGFAGVEVLPAGRHVAVTPGDGARIVVSPAPWLPDATLRGLDPEAQIDHAEALLVEAVRAATTFPADERVVDLTGGKDSRLVLAGILLAGCADEFAFRTEGPPGLPDVVVASELAAAFGLRHSAGVPSGSYADSFEDRVRAFVEATAAMHNPWQMKARPAEVPDRIRLNGLFGEPLRSYVHRRIDGPADVARFYGTRSGKLGLLRPESAAAWQACIEVEAAHDQTPDATGHDLLDAYQLRNRVIAGLGIREELGGVPRLIPLGQGGLIQVAFALGSDARRSARLHRELMARASPALADHRFAEHGAPAPRPAAGASSPVATPAAPLEQQGRKDVNWAMVRRERAPADPRRELITSVLADRSGPAWDHLDPERVDEAIARYPSLNAQERQELAGAAGAVIWLGG